MAPLNNQNGTSAEVWCVGCVESSHIRRRLRVDLFVASKRHSVQVVRRLCGDLLLALKSHYV